MMMRLRVSLAMGVGKNLKKAVELYTKACDGGFQQACDALKRPE
jgi:TPR repeat protein